MKKYTTVPKAKPQFSLGQVVVTSGVDAKMKKDEAFRKFVYVSIGQYARCDWGNTCDEDKITNDAAVKNGERVLAVYTLRKSDTTVWTIWIITEWDRSCTTVLFPDEY